MTLDLNTLLIRNPDMVSTDMDGETVMMSIERGAYYGIKGVGARAWDLLETPLTFAELCERLATEYDVTLERCQIDVKAFVEDLIEHQLVSIS